MMRLPPTSPTLRDALQHLALRRERDQRWVTHMTRRTQLCQACRAAITTLRAMLPRQHAGRRKQ